MRHLFHVLPLCSSSLELILFVCLFLIKVHHICNSWLSVFRSIFEITQDDVLFLASPLTFDPSVVELFIALTSGASILIVPNAVKMMPLELSTALFSHHHVTVLQVGNN